MTAHMAEAAQSTPLERILVVRLGAMGDVIHALPAVAAIRDAFPAARIGWAVEERWADLLSTAEARTAPRSPQKPLVDWIHIVNTKAWRAALFSDETWNEARLAIRELWEARYGAAVDFQGAMKSALLAQLSGAMLRYGFAQPREKPATLFYSRQVEARGAHVIEQNLGLASALTEHAAESARCVLPLDPVAEDWAEHQLRQHGVGAFVLMSPGAGWGAKCWPAERYGAVAKALAAEGLQTLVNVGPGEESLARAVEEASAGAAEGVSLSLGELIAITRRASLFIGGDTGPLHLAAALQIPVVGVFGPTDPARNGPYGTPNVVLTSADSRISYTHTQQVDPGLMQITVEQVVAAARQLLARGVRA